MTAQRMRKYAAWAFAAAFAVFAAVFLMDRGADSILVVFGQLAAILLSAVAVILMVISLFFPHEVE